MADRSICSNDDRPFYRYPLALSDRWKMRTTLNILFLTAFFVMESVIYYRRKKHLMFKLNVIALFASLILFFMEMSKHE